MVCVRCSHVASHSWWCKRWRFLRSYACLQVEVTIRRLSYSMSLVSICMNEWMNVSIYIKNIRFIFKQIHCIAMKYEQLHHHQQQQQKPKKRQTIKGTSWKAIRKWKPRWKRFCLRQCIIVLSHSFVDVFYCLLNITLRYFTGWNFDVLFIDGFGFIHCASTLPSHTHTSSATKRTLQSWQNNELTSAHSCGTWICIRRKIGFMNML